MTEAPEAIKSAVKKYSIEEIEVRSQQESKELVKRFTYLAR